MRHGVKRAEMRPTKRGIAAAMAALGLCLVISSLVRGRQAGQKSPPPAPRHTIRTEKSVMVPMRDGTKLSTDIYFPEGGGEKLPVILARTPYDKRGWKSSALRFAEQGYIVAVQDVRGKFESEGKYIVSAADAQDGYDAVTWFAAQPWSSGKVGTYGCSYLGEDQIEMAKMRHPNHAAMIPQASGGSYRYFGSVLGGAFELAASADWFLRNGAKVRPALQPTDIPREEYIRAAAHFDLKPARRAVDWPKVWRTLPLVDQLRRLDAPPTDFEGFVSHGPGDSYWDQFGYIKPEDRFDTPALLVDSYMDYGGADTMRLFEQLRRNGESPRSRDNIFAILAPTTHCAFESATADTIVGERHVGDARFDYFGVYLQWFDYWLKGIDNGVIKRPKLQIYVMGKSEWREAQEWPLPRTQFTSFYLHGGGEANSRFGDGTLSSKKPSSEPSDSFVYDPGTPVPSRGGPDFGASLPDFPPGSWDQSDVEMRQDVLVYTTPPLERGIEVTGPLEAILYVSSSARDTDFTAKLVDVYPDGKAFNVQEGILRARYRESFSKTVFMKPGEVYEVKIDLQATSNYFAPGHRLRLEVSSSSFPRFDRNLNTGGNNYDEITWEVAMNTVHHSSRYPSRLVLPIIRD